MKRRKEGKMKALINILLLCPFFAACTQVEVCSETEHPHTATLHVAIDFGENEARKPETVQVIASRIVNTWRYAFTMPTTLGEAVTPPVAPSVTARATGDTNAGTEPEPASVHLKSGEYTFFFVGQNESLEIEKLDSYIADYQYSMRDLSLVVKKVKKADIPELEGVDWVDFNPGQPFIAYKGPVFKDLQHDVSLFSGKESTIHSTLNPITQKLFVDFNIKLEGAVTVDKIIAELSGVVSRVGLLNNALDKERTGRIIFRPEVQGGQVGGTLAFRGEFEVLGVIGSKSKKNVTGPGIMQMAIYVEAAGKKKIFHAGINLMKCISDAGLTETVKDGNSEYIVVTKSEGTLNIEQELTINADKIVEWEDGEGFDVWFDSQDIDIEA